MQLCFRGQSSHLLECKGSETFGQLKVCCLFFVSLIKFIFFQNQIAALESLKAEEICLYACGVPVSDGDIVSTFESKDIELTVGLPGGKVHGSLARAGTFCNFII